MLQTVCYGFIYLFEVLACYMFFENIYYRKEDNKPIFYTSYIVAFIIQYGLSFVSVPLINLLAFVVCSFAICLLCYETNVKYGIFSSLMLTVLMFVTEMIIVYTSSMLLKIDLTAYENDILVLVTQSSLSKLLFFVAIFFVSKLIKRKMQRFPTDKYALLLIFLPLTSIVILYFLTYFEINYNVVAPYNTALTICSILLLFANIFVFYIHETVQRTNYENMQLQLEKQYTDISADFYEALSREYDNSRILIHDIKRHLNYIADKTADGEPQEVLKYISSVTGEFGLYDRIKYSGYPIVDAMINRYVHFCKRDGIKLEIEPLMTGLTFMLDSDIIALLGNLFDNAVEAAIKADEPRVMIGIHHAGEKITVIRVSNTCKSAPKAILGKLITSKLLNKDKHGIGTKSIMRVVEKYDGDFRWEYDKETKIFTASVFVQDTGVKK